MSLGTITIKQGDTIRWGGVWRAGGVPVDLTGTELRASIRTAEGLEVAAPTVTPGNQVTARGTFTVVLADSSAIPVGTYVADLRAKQPDTDTYGTGSWYVEVLPAVTPRW